MYKILLDPGHGGKDRANVGKNGYVEADGVLAISLKLKRILEATGQFIVDLTRSKDETVSLYTRGTLAKGYDMFISEHTDAGGGSGTTVFHSVDIPSDEEIAKGFALSIARATGRPNRGAKTKYATGTFVDNGLKGEDYYRVIDDAQDSGCPHVFLIESLFHDNVIDEKILLSDAGLELIAKAQADVIISFFKVKPVVEKSVFEVARDKMVELGITDGSNPKAPATREEVWVMLERMYREVKK